MSAMQVKVSGRWSTRGFVNLFGWRVQLWRKSGSVDTSIPVRDMEESVNLGNVLKLYVRLTGRTVSAEIGAEGLSIPIWRNTLVPGMPAIPVRAEWNGNRFEGVVQVIL